jgi:phosphatidylglycerol:prolipoprotein diacylglycerol transferase
MCQYLDLGKGVIIPMYNLMIGIGIIAGFFVLDLRIKKFNIEYKLEIDLYIGATLSLMTGFFGAKLFELFYSKQNITLQYLLNGGMTFYGGLIFGAFIFILYNIIRKNSITYTTNILMASVVIAYAFGRIGCFLGGCCFGKPTASFFGIVFPESSIPHQYYRYSIPIYPTQIFEAVYLFIIFIFLVKLITLKDNLIFFLIFYGIFRFFIEFLRGDDRGELFINILSPSQIISIILVSIGLILKIFLTIQRKSRVPCTGIA